MKQSSKSGIPETALVGADEHLRAKIRIFEGFWGLGTEKAEGFRRAKLKAAVAILTLSVSLLMLWLELTGIIWNFLPLFPYQPNKIQRKGIRKQPIENNF